MAMGKDSKHRMLSLLSRGRHPDASDLAVSCEEYARLVIDPEKAGYISGAYVSFCDSAMSGNLLSSASLTEKGKEEASRGGLLRRILGKP